MPLYQYRCRECGHDLEVRQSFSDDPLAECPNCGAPQGLFRVIQATGVVFKGSGFYINDSKGSKRELTSTSKKAEGDSTAASSGDSASKSTSSETPSASSTPSTPAASSSPSAT